MEDIEIEYLDEYKDFVLPGIKTNDARSTAASAEQTSSRLRKSTCVSSDSSDSSSIDPDIFSKLFDGKFLDDELLNDSGSNQKEKSRRRLSSTSNDSTDALDTLYNRQRIKSKDKRRNRQESFDSIDDLGEALMGPTPNQILKKFTGNQIQPKKSQNEGLIKSSKLNVYKPSSSAVSRPKIKTDNFRHVSRSNNRTSSSSSSNFSQHCNKKKPVTILKAHKNFMPSKYEPKEDPLDLEDTSDEMDSDSSYEFESDFYGDGDTDEEDTAGPTFVINTSSESDTVSPVISEDEDGGSHHHNNEQLHLYLNNLSSAETPPSIFNDSESINSDQKQVNDTANQALAEAEEPSSSTSSNPTVKHTETAPQDDFVDSSLTYDKIERLTLDITEQINNMDAELSFEFEKRSASKPRSNSYSTGLNHVRKLNYSNTSGLRRTKSDTVFPKRGRGRPPKKRKNTTEEQSKLDAHSPKKKVETTKQKSNNESNNKVRLEPRSRTKKTTKKRSGQRKRKSKQNNNATKTIDSDNSTDHTSEVPLYIKKNKNDSDVKGLNRDFPSDMTPNTRVSESLIKSQEPVTVTVSEETEMKEISSILEKLDGNSQEAKTRFEPKESVERKMVETSAGQSPKEISSVKSACESTGKFTDVRAVDTDRMAEIQYDLEKSRTLDVEEKLAEMSVPVDAVEQKGIEHSTGEATVSSIKQTDEENKMELKKIETTTKANSNNVVAAVRSTSDSVENERAFDTDIQLEMKTFPANVEQESAHQVENSIEEQFAQVESGIELSKLSDNVNFVKPKDTELSTVDSAVPIIQQAEKENKTEKLAKEAATSDNNIDAVEKSEISDADNSMEFTQNQIGCNKPVTENVAIQAKTPVKSAKLKKISKLSTTDNVPRKALRSGTPMSGSNSDQVSDAEATGTAGRRSKRTCWKEVDKLVADRSLQRRSSPRSCAKSLADTASRNVLITDAQKKFDKNSHVPKEEIVKTAIEEKTLIETEKTTKENVTEIDDNVLKNNNIESSVSSFEHLKADLVDSKVPEANKEIQIDDQEVNKLHATSDSKVEQKLDKDNSSDAKESTISNKTDMKISPRKTSKKFLKKQKRKKEKLLKSNDSAQVKSDNALTVTPEIIEENKAVDVLHEAIADMSVKQNSVQEAVPLIKESTTNELTSSIESTSTLDASNVKLLESETTTAKKLTTKEVCNKDQAIALDPPLAALNVENPGKGPRNKSVRKSYIERHLEEFRAHGLAICGNQSRSTRSKTKTPDVTAARHVRMCRNKTTNKLISNITASKSDEVKESTHNDANELIVTAGVERVEPVDTKEHIDEEARGKSVVFITKPTTETAPLTASTIDCTTALSTANTILLSQCRKFCVRIKRLNLVSLGYIKQSDEEKKEATKCTIQQMDISSDISPIPTSTEEALVTQDKQDNDPNTKCDHTSDISAIPANTEEPMVTQDKQDNDPNTTSVHTSEISVIPSNALVTQDTQDNSTKTICDSTETPTKHTADSTTVTTDKLVTEEAVASTFQAAEESVPVSKESTEEHINKSRSLSKMNESLAEKTEEPESTDHSQPVDSLGNEVDKMDNSQECENNANQPDKQPEREHLAMEAAKKDKKVNDNAITEENDLLKQSMVHETTGVTSSVDNDSDKGDNNSVSLARSLRKREPDATKSDELANSKQMLQRKHANSINVMAPPAPPKRELPTGKTVLKRLGKHTQEPKEKRRKITDPLVDDGDVSALDSVDYLSVPATMESKESPTQVNVRKAKTTLKNGKKSLPKETARVKSLTPTGSPVISRLNALTESPVKSKLSTLLASSNSSLTIDNSVIITKTPLNNPTEQLKKAEVQPSNAGDIKISIVVLNDNNNANNTTALPSSKPLTQPAAVKKLSASKRLTVSSSPVQVKKSLPFVERGKKLNSDKKDAVSTAVEKQLSSMAKKVDSLFAAVGNKPIASINNLEGKAPNIVTRKSRQAQPKETPATITSAEKTEQTVNGANSNEKIDAAKVVGKSPKKRSTKPKESPKIAATTVESATSNTITETLKTNPIESPKATNDYAKRFAHSKFSELPASRDNIATRAAVVTEPKQQQSTKQLLESLEPKPQRPSRRSLKLAANLMAQTEKSTAQNADLPAEKSDSNQSILTALLTTSTTSKLVLSPSKQPTEQLDGESSQQPSERSNQKPAKQQPEQPNQRSAKQPPQQPAKQSSQQPPQQPAKQSSQQPAKQPPQQPAKQPPQQPAKKTQQQSAKQTQQQSAKKTQQQSAKQTQQQSAKQTQQQSAKQTQQQSAKQTQQQSAKQTQQQPAKQTQQQHQQQHQQQPPQQLAKQSPQQPAKQSIQQLAKKSSQHLVKESSQQPSEQHNQKSTKQANQRSVKQSQQQPAEQLSQQQPAQEHTGTLASSAGKRKLPTEDTSNAKRAKSQTGASIAFPVRIIAAAETAKNVMTADALPVCLSTATPAVTLKETPKSNGLGVSSQVLPAKQNKCCVRLNRSIVKRWLLEQEQQRQRIQSAQVNAAVTSTTCTTLVVNAKAPEATAINRAALVQNNQLLQQQPVKTVPLPLPLLEVKTEQEDIEMTDQQQQPAVQVLPPTVVSQPLSTAPQHAVQMEMDIVDAFPPVVTASDNSNITPHSSSSQSSNHLANSSSNSNNVVALANSGIDANTFGSTRMFSFLHPSRYHHSYGNVGLEFCCPNLDGPMPAIDPTRLHTKVEVPVLELPQFMVISTRIISRQDKNIPPKVRAKLEELSAKDALPNVMKETQTTGATVAAPSKPVGTAAVVPPVAIPSVIPIATPGPISLPTAAAVGVGLGAPPPLVKINNIDRMSKQLPRGTQIAKMPATTVAAAAPPAATGSVKASNLVPNLLQLPPIYPSDKERLELQTRVQVLDMVLQNLARQAAIMSIAERKLVIENIVRTSNLLPIDVDMGTKFLQNYANYINEVTKTIVPPMPLLRTIITPVTSTCTTTASTTNTTLSNPHMTTPATATVNTPKPAITTGPLVDGNQPCRRIFDKNNHVIGYQYKTPKLSLNNATSGVKALLSTGTPTLFSPQQQQQARLQLVPSARRDYAVPINASNNKLTVSPVAPTGAAAVARTSKRFGNDTKNSLNSSREPTGIISKVGTTIPAKNSSPNNSPPSAVDSLISKERRADCNLFIVNQVLSQPEECILPDGVSTADASAFATEIKGEVDDAENLT